MCKGSWQNLTSHQLCKQERFIQQMHWVTGTHESSWECPQSVPISVDEFNKFVGLIVCCYFWWGVPPEIDDICTDYTMLKWYLCWFMGLTDRFLCWFQGLKDPSAVRLIDVTSSAASIQYPIDIYADSQTKGLFYLRVCVCVGGVPPAHGWTDAHWQH